MNNESKVNIEDIKFYRGYEYDIVDGPSTAEEIEKAKNCIGIHLCSYDAWMFIPKKLNVKGNKLKLNIRVYEAEIPHVIGIRGQNINRVKRDISETIANYGYNIKSEDIYIRVKPLLTSINTSNPSNTWNYLANYFTDDQNIIKDNYAKILYKDGSIKYCRFDKHEKFVGIYKDKDFDNPVNFIGRLWDIDSKIFEGAENVYLNDTDKLLLVKAVWSYENENQN